MENWSTCICYFYGKLFFPTTLFSQLHVNYQHHFKKQRPDSKWQNVVFFSENIALNKTTWQHGNYDNGNPMYAASQAVDGDSSGDVFNNNWSCTVADYRTSDHYVGWWAVDLSTTYTVTSVTLTPREDVTWHRTCSYIDSTKFWYNSRLANC